MKIKRTVVVTGAAGMIGSGVVRQLNDRGYRDLLLVDDFKTSDKWKNLVGKTFSDLISRHRLMDWLKEREADIGAVIHLGACSDTMEADADYLLENNYRFTIRLAEWAMSCNKRFIYASSAATYGDGSLGFSDDEDSIQHLRPLNMYGYSKHLVDLWMKKEGALKKAVGLKYFNVFGPNENHKGRMSSMVYKMSQKAQRDGVVSLYRSSDPKLRDGEQSRDFIYLKDAVRMTCDFLEHSDAAGLYNIGRGIPTTWNQLAAALFFALDRTRNIEYVEMPADLLKQYQNYTCADMRKFHKIFPKASTMSIEAAVQEYVREYLLACARW